MKTCRIYLLLPFHHECHGLFLLPQWSQILDALFLPFVLLGKAHIHIFGTFLSLHYLIVFVVASHDYMPPQHKLIDWLIDWSVVVVVSYYIILCVCIYIYVCVYLCLCVYIHIYHCLNNTRLQCQGLKQREEKLSWMNLCETIKPQEGWTNLSMNNYMCLETSVWSISFLRFKCGFVY